MRELERRVVLSVLDRKWREHLYEMDYLREGIDLRAYAQRDPLVEYQREGFDMFAAMMDGIKEESVGFLFNLEVQVEEGEEEAEVEEVVEPLRQPVPPRRAAARARTPQIRAKGLERAAAADRTCPTPPAERAAASVEVRPACHGHQRRRPLRGTRPQRRVPLRLGQEVQEVPRRSGRPHGAHRARQRLSRRSADPRRGQANSRALHCQRPPSSSKRAASARERWP